MVSIEMRHSKYVRSRIVQNHYFDGIWWLIWSKAYQNKPKQSPGSLQNARHGQLGHSEDQCWTVYLVDCPASEMGYQNGNSVLDYITRWKPFDLLGTLYWLPFSENWSNQKIVSDLVSSTNFLTNYVETSIPESCWGVYFTGWTQIHDTKSRKKHEFSKKA